MQPTQMKYSTNSGNEVNNCIAILYLTPLQEQ